MAILTALASAALAAAAGSAPHTEGAAHGAEHKTGLPQLAVETFAGQLFWLAIAFVLLYVLLAFVVIPRIRNVLETRRSRIAGDLAAAASAKEAADAALKAYDAALNDARTRGRKLADETRAKVKGETEAARHAAEEKLNADLVAADGRIAAMKTAAMSNVRSVAAETAAEIVARLTGESVAAADAGAAVDAALTR
jgi:F-type H+-transporting ATPase subunit b